jgi:hypothetical protein
LLASILKPDTKIAPDAGFFSDHSLTLIAKEGSDINCTIDI